MPQIITSMPMIPKIYAYFLVRSFSWQSFWNKRIRWFVTRIRGELISVFLILSPDSRGVAPY